MFFFVSWLFRLFYFYVLCVFHVYPMVLFPVCFMFAGVVFAVLFCAFCMLSSFLWDFRMFVPYVVSVCFVSVTKTWFEIRPVLLLCGALLEMHRVFLVFQVCPCPGYNSPNSTIARFQGPNLRYWGPDWISLYSRIARAQVPNPRYLSPKCISLYSRIARSRVPKPVRRYLTPGI